jgi:hypothetical protein
MFKYRFVFLALSLVMLFAMTPAQAQHLPAAADGAIVNVGAAPLDPSSDLTQDPGDEGCGPIDPSRPCYNSGGSTTEVCVKATSYTTCKSKCECEYRNNKKKCKASAPCIDLATAERNACLGNCLVDWA